MAPPATPRASSSSTARPTEPALDPRHGAAIAGTALALVPILWVYTRHVVTLVHEAGHAVVALLTGRRLDGIRLHRDTSGLTTSIGRPRGPGMVATAAAGYLAPSGLGLAGALLVDAGRTAWALWAGLVTLALMLVFIRNWFGLLVVALAAAAVALLIWRTPEPVQEVAALTFSWLLLAGGARTSVELWGHRRRSRTRTSDADVLARLTHLPAAVWNVVFVVLTAAALVPAARVVG